MLLLVSVYVNAQSFSSPESVKYDAIHQRYIVSNTNSNNLQQHIPGSAPTLFKSGVTSPFGNTIVGDTVFVCAQNGYIKSYNLTTAALVGNVNLGATFLNGICSDNSGNIFASDFSGKKVYRYNIATQQFNVFCSTGTKTPNGIVFDAINNRLVVATWNANASILGISLIDSTVTTLKTTTITSFDGIAMDEDGNFYGSAWMNNAQGIYFFDAAFANAPLKIISFANGTNAADIYYNMLSDTLAVPSTGNSTVTYYGFPRPVVQNDTVTVTVGNTQTICVLQNDFAANNTPLLLTDYTFPVNGTLNLQSNCLDYEALVAGTETITYTVCTNDTPSFCRTGILVITNQLGGGNHAPVANDDTASTTQPNSITINVVANDLDADLADTLCVTSIYGSNFFSLSASNCGNVIFTPDSSFTGNDTCWYVLCDNGSPVLCDTGMFVVMVGACSMPDFSLSFLCSNGSQGGGGCYYCGKIVASGTNVNLVLWSVIDESHSYIDTTLINDDTLSISMGCVEMSNPDLNIPLGIRYYVCATVQNFCGTKTICDTVQIWWSSISEISLSNISLFPNPANNLLTIDMQNNSEEITRSYSSIEIVNALGEKQKSISRKGTNKIVSLDVADLPNGIYLATIISDKKERRMLGKFTINR